MRRIMILGTVLAFVLSLSTPGLAMIYNPPNKGGLFTYYFDSLYAAQNNQPVTRVFVDGDRQEIEVKNRNGEWQLVQIRNTSTGVVTNYRNRKFIDYTRELKDDIVAHYSTYRSVMSDPEGKGANFYTVSEEETVAY